MARKRHDGLRVAHVASEMVPFSKTGGLADVAGALPAAQAALGAAVTVVTPAYRSGADAAPPGDVVGEVEALGLHAAVRRTSHDGVTVLLIDAPVLFARPALYGVGAAAYPDNPVRFSFFARAALDAVAAQGGADAVHAHDWQAALAPLLLRTGLHRPTALAAAGTVLTIHNLAYQGLFPPWAVAAAGLPAELFDIAWLEFYSQASFLKGGLVSAGALTTVSPTYAGEILTPAFGCGLEGVLAARKGNLRGILNGLDGALWNPRTDRHLPRTYSASTAGPGKSAARLSLAAEAALAPGDRPVAGMVSRLAEQKGADLVAGALDDLVAMGFDIVVLGDGEERFVEQLRAGESAHPGRVRLLNRFDERLAHLIYAASDIFLMPSRYEPCGLGQMIAMRYGALPVVHRTGGLADTVADVSGAEGTGVVFDQLTAAALATAAGRARRLLDEPAARDAARHAGMARDFSWRGPAREYLDLYRSLGG